MSTSQSRVNWRQRPQALVAFVVGFLAFAGQIAEAGVMLPWVDAPLSTAVDFPADGCGPSRKIEHLTSRDLGTGEGDECLRCEGIVAGFLGTGGGATAPVNSATGQTSLLLAAMFQLPAVLPLLTCLSRRLRERSLQLPQPPVGELLDPPKAIA